eukprot:11081784-Prorocentrum_lima.AAC.1
MLAVARPSWTLSDADGAMGDYLHGWLNTPPDESVVDRLPTGSRAASPSFPMASCRSLSSEYG